MNLEWFAASERGDTQALARIFERGIEVDTPGAYQWTALMLAVWNQHPQTVQWLLSRGADPNRESVSWSAMTVGSLWARGWHISAGRCYAVLKPNTLYLDLLLAAGGRIGLREAILLGDVEAARRAIDEDPSIDINGESLFGMHDTFLMLAAHVGPVAMVDLLLDKGAEIDEPDDIGTTPLMLAAEMGRVDIINRLVDRGADVKSKWLGDTALRRASENGHTEAVTCLLSHGAKWAECDTDD
jgi:ankyrin repeat protein